MSGSGPPEEAVGSQATIISRLFGYLFMGISLFIVSFWGYSTGYRLYGIAIRRESLETDLHGGVMAPVLQFLIWGILAAVLFVLGRRLMDPRRHDRKIVDLARQAVAAAGDTEGAEAPADGVSRLYEDLTLEQLVLVNSAMDRRTYPARHTKLIAQMRRRLLELEEESGAGKG